MKDDGTVSEGGFEENDDWSSVTAGPDIIVRAGQTLPIEGGRSYSVNSITIEAGGTLLIENQLREWTMIRAAGTVEVLGQIVVNPMPSKPGVPEDTVEKTAPDGTVLRQVFRYRNGGTGGQGGGYPRASNGTRGPGAPGGLGYGGGGGGGASNDNRRGGNQTPGHAANGRTGGAPRSDRREPGGAGGNGGESGAFGDGGLLFIRAEAAFKGGGVVTINGAPGHPGSAGQNSGTGGGGGGGSAGYPGGAFVLLCIGDIEQPEVRKTGGAGGGGGTAGRSRSTYPGNNGNEHGDPGAGGPEGHAGKFVFIPGPWVN